MGDFTITEALRAAFKRRNIVYYALRNATPEEFSTYDEAGAYRDRLIKEIDAEEDND